MKPTFVAVLAAAVLIGPGIQSSAAGKGGISAQSATPNGITIRLDTDVASKDDAEDEARRHCRSHRQGYEETERRTADGAVVIEYRCVRD